MSLTFEEEGHIYRYAGQRVPSVTTALSLIERTFAFVDPGVLEAARAFGRHVHKAIELFNLGTLDEDELDPALAPYLAQWKRFVIDTGFEVHEGEQLVYHPKFRYAGRSDVVGSMRRSSWLIDLKSGAVPRTCALQTSGYQEATPQKPRKRAALQLAPDRYNLIEYRDPADFNYFISAVNCWRWTNQGASSNGRG